MVYQGTVSGSSLWTYVFLSFEKDLYRTSFSPVIYADDLNAHGAFSRHTDNDTFFRESERCQEELHKWGRANQIELALSKESRHPFLILLRKEKTSKLLVYMLTANSPFFCAADCLIFECFWKTLFTATPNIFLRLSDDPDVQSSCPQLHRVSYTRILSYYQNYVGSSRSNSRLIFEADWR